MPLQLILCKLDVGMIYVAVVVTSVFDRIADVGHITLYGLRRTEYIRVLVRIEVFRIGTELLLVEVVT